MLTLASLAAIAPDHLRCAFSVPLRVERFFEDFWTCTNFDEFEGYSSTSVDVLRVARYAELRALLLLREHQADIEHHAAKSKFDAGSIIGTVKQLTEANQVCRVLKVPPFTGLFVEKHLPQIDDQELLLWSVTADRFPLEQRQRTLLSLLQEALLYTVKSGDLSPVPSVLFSYPEFQQPVRLWLALAWNACRDNNDHTNFTALDSYFKHLPVIPGSPEEFVQHYCPSIAPMWDLVKDLDTPFEQLVPMLKPEGAPLEEARQVALPDGLAP